MEKQILRYVAELYFREIKNTNIGFVTFTRCELSPDARLARIYVSIPGEEISGVELSGGKNKRKSFEALQHTAKFIKGRLGRLLALKHVPEVEFVLDDSLEKAARIDELLSGTPPDLLQEKESQDRSAE